MDSCKVRRGHGEDEIHWCHRSLRAFSTGAVRNVLLASQSHEAVNNAAESVLKLFRGEGRGTESRSARGSGRKRLRHPEALSLRESGSQHYREQFRAGLKQRFRVAVADWIARRIHGQSSFFRKQRFGRCSITFKLSWRSNKAQLRSPDVQHRASGLRETLHRLSQDLGIGAAGLDWDDGGAYDTIIKYLAGSSRGRDCRSGPAIACGKRRSPVTWMNTNHFSIGSPSSRRHEKPVGLSFAPMRNNARADPSRKLLSVSNSGILRNACKIDTVDSYQGKDNSDRYSVSREE